MKYTLIAMYGVLLQSHAAEFVNLTFENPDLSGSLRPVFTEFPNGPFQGNSSQILRGWSLTADGMQMPTTTISPFGELPASQRTANLIEAPPAEWSGPSGRYYIYFNSGNLPLGPELRLSQTGTIPVDATGLRVFGNGSWYMQINGEIVGTELQNQVLPVDVSRFAGQTVLLECVFPRGSSGRFDIFGFAQVPEPSTWTLFGVGAIALACMRKPLGTRP